MSIIRILKKDLMTPNLVKMIKVKFWSLSAWFLITTSLLSDFSEAQINSPFICKPKEIGKEKFDELTKVLLTYPSINKGIKELSSDGNCLMYISNNAEFLLGVVFYLDSNYAIKRAYFTKFSKDVKGKQPIVALKKKQIKKFESLKIDTVDLGHFLSCSTNSLHEDKEIVIVLKETEISSGLYLRGNPIFPRDQNDNGLIAFREEIRDIKIPKKLYHM